MLVVLVSTDDPGLEIFATHRVFPGRTTPRRRTAPGRGERARRARPASNDARGGGRVPRRPGGLLEGDAGQLDVQLVDRSATRGSRTRPTGARRGTGRPRRGGTACCSGRPAIEDVFAAARRGDVLPQKTTYFFPKLLSGLLFHPSRDGLARGLPRGVADVDDVLAELPTRAEREPVLGSARAATTRPRSTRRRRRRSSAPARLDVPLTLVSEELGELEFGGGAAVAGRRRPDRRLAEREAGHPVLLALARGRRRAGHARRGLRLRLRLRDPRGVDGRARRRRLPGGERLGAVRPKDKIEILSFEATTTAFVAESASAVAARVPASDHGLARALALPPRRRARRRRLLAEAGALGRHRRRAALVRECGLAVELFESPPFEDAPLDLVRPLAGRRRRDARALRPARLRARAKPSSVATRRFGATIR